MGGACYSARAQAPEPLDIRSGFPFRRGLGRRPGGPSHPRGGIRAPPTLDKRMHLLSALLSEGSLIDLDGTLFIQMGLFFLAFLILKALVFGPVIRLIEKRDEMIDGARLQAKALQAEAASSEDELAAQMRAARLKAGEEREKLRAEGKRLEAQVLEKVRAETAKQLAGAETKLDAEAAQVRSDMQAQTPVLARQIASKLLEREVA